MFTQLNPPIPVYIVGKGSGSAIGVIDYSQEHNLVWVTALDDGGEIWCAPNPTVRLTKNWTMGRSIKPCSSATPDFVDMPVTG
ncbi:hypothetical protein GRI97_15670 [Altererythrobacter xixiisoli]|uniref:Uncharacterized protein n=1 Tax=Croceibacterium xixiisoli TaxID=1476466 RepID=A0A6I4TZ78_9SPHN|nr:hypothetical protein [Croceibacterium xixiisoli]MXP00430.1 hypothetical protein [Croceibacterium xixiisoli]